jgi:hypothetical protein
MFAQSPPDISGFGHEVRVEPSQVAHNVRCVLCSVTIQGEVTGNVHVFAGDILLQSKVDGNVLLLGGNLSVASQAQTAGKVVVFGGHLRGDGGSLTRPPEVVSALVFLPLVLLVCLLVGGLAVLARRAVRGPVVYPTLPRL